MSYRLPAPLREQYSTEGQFRNPAGTVPLPNPTNMPASAWFANRALLGWTTAPGSTPYATGTWGSPTFDLQPQLRGLAPSGTSNNRRAVGAVPIWNSRGKYLHIQIEGLYANSRSRTSLVVLSREYGHISDRGKIDTSAISVGSDSTQLTQNADITAHITTDTPTAILNFRPWGEGSYIRYWKLILEFQQVEQQPANFLPELTISAAFY